MSTSAVARLNFSASFVFGKNICYIYTKYLHQQNRKQKVIYNKICVHFLNATKVKKKSRCAIASKDMAFASLISKKTSTNNCMHTPSLHIVPKADKELTSL
jgi:hypothetical protein